MNQPNELLRQARERMSSRQMPGVPLSRQELAELVNTWMFKQMGKMIELDANYVGKLERGVIRWPTGHIAKASAQCLVLRPMPNLALAAVG